MFSKQLIFALLLICLSAGPTLGRVPPRNSQVETEEAPAVEAAKAKEESPTEPEKTPVSEVAAPAAGNDETPNQDKPKKPIGVILFRTQPQISIFRDHSPFEHSPGFQPFPTLDAPSLFQMRHGGSFGAHDDRALRLLSILFGNRAFRPLNFPTESGETESANASTNESSAESTETDRRDVHPFESLFPGIFVPRFPPIDAEKPDAEKPDGETAASNNDEKTPSNFENKEKKVINIGGRKFVKTTQTKKVKNDFGEFHSVISSYQPFDEKIHDENGNEKASPSEESGIDKKDVNKDAEPSSSTKPVVEVSTAEPVDVQPSSSSSTQQPPAVEKEVEETPDLKAEEPEEKKPEALNKVDESKNEIPDKAEIKVDQMS